MSLIDEALKRARHEASRQEAVKRDAARHDGPRPIPKLYADRQTSRAPLWAGIATGAAVALLGVVAWLLWGRAPVAPPAAPHVAVTGAPLATVPADPPTVASPTPSAEQPAPRPPSAATAPQEPVPALRVSRPEAPPAPPVAPQPVREQPAKLEEPPAAAPKPALSAPRTSPPAAASTAPAGATQTFVREATLPGGGPRLRLGGIAYSEEAPIALINGAALGKGEVVEGYVVRRIDAAEVELEGPGGRVVLRLK